ncbi:hypothetical protein [Sphingomonas sp. G-3-2-10]|uniref:hypothetical protein n=1 Tax=Sphingomonas sp. G-3-2-10 TaxID=2728838 RepID=UPI00146B37AE|nr:hypothetical protein [Sphingomonas sp. G-3-2-10]NML07258.1 hypothetical protein [Sphingomonas sp. G-3-2-10]
MGDMLALAALMLAAPAKPIIVDDLVKFSDRSRCEPAEPFRRMLDQLWAMRGDSRLSFRGAVSRAYQPAFGATWSAIGNNGATDMVVETNATWHGLPLTSIALITRYGVPGIRLELTVDATARRTRSMLNPLGFRFAGRDEGVAAPWDLKHGERVKTVLSCTLPQD